jgi:Gram-negative bacterial TonB protein C-terminal
MTPALRQPLALCAVLALAVIVVPTLRAQSSPSQESPSSPSPQQPTHVQPGQLAQSTLPKPFVSPPRPPAPPPLTATSLSDAAAKIAGALADFHARRVAILDFAIPQSVAWNRPGQKLADEFRADLTAAAPTVEQLSREDTLKYMKHFDLMQQDLPIPGVASYVFEHSNIDAWVVAGITLTGNDAIELAFTVHASDPRGTSANLTLPMNVAPELAALAAPSPNGEFASIPTAGTDGNTSPVCLYCPIAEYSDDAVKAQIQGTTLLKATIGTDGRAHDVRVTKRLPFGLSEIAVKSVDGWKFAPAKDRDGNPVAVRQTIEVQFHLY